MKNYLLMSGLAVILIGVTPAFAQTANPSAAAQPDPAATAPTPAPMSDKDQAALTKCKAMTQAQIAQSSKCTKLMKDAGIKAPPKDPFADQR